MTSGITILIPSYTFKSCKGVDFDPAVTPSEVGALGNWVTDLPEFQRSNHPIYSHQIAGPLTTKLLKSRNTTTFGDDSIFAYLEKFNARIIMLGCDWTYCTYFHRFEEEAQVPYREYKTFNCSTSKNKSAPIIPIKMLSPLVSSVFFSMSSEKLPSLLMSLKYCRLVALF